MFQTEALASSDTEHKSSWGSYYFIPGMSSYATFHMQDIEAMMEPLMGVWIFILFNCAHSPPFHNLLWQ